MRFLVHDHEVGGLFHRARLMRGWTQEELAARAGLWPSMIDHIETGGELDRDLFKAIADALGVETLARAMPEGGFPGES